MKKIASIIVLIISFCSLVAQNPVYVNRTMSSNDPNKNANWDWTLNETHTIYYNTQSQSGSINNITLRLPYYLNGHPATILNTEMDIYPKDGWVLVYRDFGLETEATKFPCYILYNKFKGTLRVIFLDVFDNGQNYTYALVNLSTEKYPSALLNFHDNAHPYLDEFDKANYKQSTMTKINNLSWSYVDFNLFGYDPSILSNSEFKLEVVGVDVGTLEAEGKLTVAKEEPKSSLAFKGLTDAIDVAADGFAQANKYYKDTKNFLDNMKEKAKDNKWYSATCEAIGNSDFLGSLNAISPAIGFITTFIGGGKSAMAQMNYDIYLKGKLTFNESLMCCFKLQVPGIGHPDPSALGIPLYDYPLGVFSLNSKPTIYFSVNCKNIDYSGGYYAGLFKPSVKIKKIEYSINTCQSDIVISSIEAAFVLKDKSPVFYPLSEFNNLLLNQYAEQSYAYPNYIDIDQVKKYVFFSYKTLQPKLAIKITITPVNTDPIYVYKVYDAAFEYEPMILESLNGTSIINNTTVNSGKTDSRKGNIIQAGNPYTYKVLDGGTANFIATESITLKTGFESNIGSSFSARILTSTTVEHSNCPYSIPVVKSISSKIISNPTTSQIIRDADKNSNIAVKQDVEDSQLKKVELFPNPSNGKFTISFEGYVLKDCKVTIANALGALIYKQCNIQSNSLDFNLNNQPKGIYFITITINGEVVTKKLLIE